MVDRYRVLLRAGRSLRVTWKYMSADTGSAVRLRVLRAGVCGTDLQILRGVRDDRAEILGHEGVAALMGNSPAAIGSEWEGGCAVLNPVNAADQDQILGHSYDGLFAEAVLAPAACVVPANARLPVDLGPLVEPVATVIYGLQLLEACRGLRTIGIWGGGTAAALTALIAGLNGFEAHVFHHRSERLSWLAGRGGLGRAEMHIVPADHRSYSQPCLDAAFICMPRQGAATALEQALSLVREDGWIDLFGGFGSGDMSPSLPGIDLGRIRRGNVSGRVMLGGIPVRRPGGRRVWLTGHRGSSSEQLRAAQQLLIAAPDYFGAMISDVISLDRATTFIPAMLSGKRPLEYLKVIIDPTMLNPVRNPDLTVTIAEVAGQACG